MKITTKENKLILENYLKTIKFLPESKFRTNSVDLHKIAEDTNLPINFLKSRSAKKLISQTKKLLSVKPSQNSLETKICVRELFTYTEKASSKDYSSNNGLMTVFKSIINHLRKTENDLVDDFFRCDPEQYKSIVESIFDTKKLETKQKYIKFALKIKEYYDSITISNSLPDSFTEAIKKIHAESGLSIGQVEKLANIKKNSAKHIIRGANTPKNTDIVIKLEKAYNLPKFTLFNKLPIKLTVENINKADMPEQYIKKFTILKPYLSDLNFEFKTASSQKKIEVCEWIMTNIIVANNDFSKKCAENVNNKYQYKHLDKSPLLKNELEKLTNFKESIIPDIKYGKIDSWNTASSEKNIKTLLYFFGFLYNFKKSTCLKKEDYTLALLLNKNLVYEYIQFKINKRGKISSDEGQFLILICSLLRENYGFIYQTEFYNNENLIKKLLSQKIIDAGDNDILSEKGWKNFCLQTRKYYYELKKQIDSRYKSTQIDRNGSIEKSRDPFKPIEPILNSDEPIKQYLSLLCKTRSKITYDSKKPLDFFYFMNGYLSLMIILQTALRAKNIRSITPSDGHNDKCEQIFKIANTYYIDIPASETKNKKRVYTEISNTNNLYSDIETYINVKKQLFNNNSKYLIVTNKNKKYPDKSFSRMIRNFIKQYICYHKYRLDPGIENLQPHGPHALRDIIATHVIKKTGSYALAAIAINDEEVTVKDHYARFLPCDKSNLYRELTSDIF